MVFILLTVSAFSQTPPADAESPTPTPTPAAAPRTPETVAKAESIVARAVEALGGERYRGVRTVVSRGLFTPFQDGVSSVPSTFVDYLVYPDKERTEFRGGGVRTIQSNSGNTGWIFDGAARTIKDMKPAQIESFQLAMQTGLEYLLRGWWRESKGVEINYLGRREAGVGRRNETVTLTHPDGLIVEYEFGAKDAMPAKILYRRKNENGEESREEDRFAQFIAVDGVLTPFIIDHYRNGLQSSRINNESVQFNQNVAADLFQKPADVKAIKK
ncbi:MAG TPA: hypothetical protein VM870_03480 [Pyrinomonadaceae bacterium]|nr:hypothetical protein [Pyrinomonadaceae bacterium]